MEPGIIITAKDRLGEELPQADRIDVYERMGETTTFNIRYQMDISEGDLTLLADDRIDAGAVLAVQAVVEGTRHCLAKGPVYRQQIHLEHGGDKSRLDVIGADTSIVMDRETKAFIWSDATDSEAVKNILEQYDYEMDIHNTNAGHFEEKHALVQRESDLRFVRRLARRNGFLFWITCDAQGRETAHFKRPPIDDGAQTDLAINLDSPSGHILNIAWDVEKPTRVEGVQMDLNSKTFLDGTVDKTPQNILGNIGLKEITGDTRSVTVAGPVDDAGDMQARGEGALIEADWFTRATCRTSLNQLGTLVRAHTVVNVNGAGSRHSGKYFVAGVRHTIDSTAHRMDVELIRNGWSA